MFGTNIDTFSSIAVIVSERSDQGTPITCFQHFFR